MTGLELALLITAVLQAGTLASGRIAAKGGAAPDAGMAGLGALLARRQAVVSILFFVTAAMAMWWRTVDGFVVLFAALFVLAQVILAVLLARGDAATMSPTALKASVVALAGLVAMVSLDLLVFEGSEGQVGP